MMRIRARHLRMAGAAAFFVLLGLAGTFPAQATHTPKHQPGPPDAPPGSSKPQSGVTYTGRAFGAFVNVPTLGVGPQFISDTGELPPDGTPQSASFLDVAVPGVLSVELLVAHTSGANSVAEGSAFLAGVNVLNGLLTAQAVGARSVATCNGVEGFTEVLDLNLAGQTITVDPFAPNQKFGPFAVDGLTTATLIINEQIQNSGQGLREITVNAVHLTVEGAVQAEVILSSARSDIHGCPGCPPQPPCHDFVTGGGWINVGSGRASFGFNAGFKGRSLDAHFNYIDHNTGMHVKVTSIASYEATGDTSRRFTGDAEIDGNPGTYVIEVADHGEPGRNTDTISISLNNGQYSAGGRLAGGNIQLHKPCP